MNIFFDLDGTLTDSKPGIVDTVKYMLEVFNKPIPNSDLGWVVGPPFEDSVAKLIGSESESEIREAISTYREKYLETGIYQNSLFPQIEETLESLQKNHTLFIATTKPTPQAEIVLKHFGIRSLFKSVYGSNMDGSMSDKKLLLAHALRQENIAPKEAIMIGDRIFDIDGAKANGLKAVAVSWGYGNASEHKDADKVVENPKNIPEIL